MELAIRHYPLFPLCGVTAIAGTILLIYISKWITNHIRSKEIIWLGRNSMIVYCLHALDRNAAAVWTLSNNGFVNTTARICFDIALCILVVSARKAFNAGEASPQSH